jgi:hypothetical protein
MRVEGLYCGRLLLCGGKVERGEAGRGKVNMVGGSGHERSKIEN